MSEPTQRWSAQEGTSAVPAVGDCASTPTPPDGLAITLVSDRMSVRGPMVAPVTFPGYEILGELGRGGMGVVYKARQRNLNRLVALKVILGGPLASEEDKARFRIEAEAAARLHHSNIVQVYDVGEYAGFSYMALELVEGQTLRQWQNGQKLDTSTASRLVSAIARAIHHAHEQGIVHRDIKPANILLAPPTTQPDLGAPASAALPTAVASAIVSDLSGEHAVPLVGTPKVTDFGLAKALENGRDLTVTGVACGTPNYMAPEQVRGKALSPAVDVYGLGAVLYELLAGRPPFVGTDAPDVMTQILKSEPPGVRKFAPNVPRDLAVIVAKCLEKDPKARYASARDAADDLDRFLAGKPIAARPIGPTERAWRWVKRNPVVAAFLFVSTIGCVVTGGLALALGQSERDERNARASAESASEVAEQQRRVAESARDELRGALTATESARQQANREKTAADLAKHAAETERAAATAAREEAKLEAERAGKKQKEADDARKRAEDNLRVARDVIRVSLRELSNHPRFEDEDFRAARLLLIEQVRTFRDAVTESAPKTAEWFDNIADVSHWLGFLEYLNNNQDGAAAEYKRAADAAGQWAALRPKNPDARGRQSFSLVNAGNALINARRYTDAAKCYRDAVGLIDGVVSELPLNAYYRAQSVEAYSQFASTLRIENQIGAWEHAARQQLDRAKALVRACGATPEHLRYVAAASLELAKAQTRLSKWSDADRSYATAVAVRDELRTAYPRATQLSFDYASALISHAGFLNFRGQTDRAAEVYLASIDIMEKGQSAAPTVNAYCVDLANACGQYGDFLSKHRRHAEAQKRYNQALELLAPVMRRSPSMLRAKETWATVSTGRAHLYNATNRHREAAAEWAKLAIEDIDHRARPRHQLFVMQSLLYAGDWKAASAAAQAQMKKEQPGWMWMEMGRVWCIALKKVEDDGDLAPADKLEATANALNQAVACLEKARALGELKKPDVRQWYASTAEFAPVRNKFDPNKK